MLEHPSETDGRVTDAVPSPVGPGDAFEAVCLHNYDHWAGHSVEVIGEDADGEVVVRERRYLSPDQSASLSPAIDPGVYRLRIRVDGVERARTGSRLDPTPSGTVVVELGNGVVSVTDGAPGTGAGP